MNFALIVAAFFLGVITGIVLMALATAQGMSDTYNTGYECGRKEERRGNDEGKVVTDILSRERAAHVGGEVKGIGSGVPD